MSQAAFQVSGILLLLIFSFIDWRWQLVPIEGVLIAMPVMALWSLALGHAWQSLLVGAMIGGSFFAIQVLLSNGRWLGSGDPYVAALIGLILGWPMIAVSLYLTYVVGGLLAGMLWWLKIIKRQSRIAFVPWLTLGMALTLLIGDHLLAWFRAATGW